MSKFYLWLEFALVLLLEVRFLCFFVKHKKINSIKFEFFGFYSVFLINGLLSYFLFGNNFAFYFPHCAFPLVLIWGLLFKNKSLLFYLSFVLILSFNVILKNQMLISISYLISFSLILFKIYKLLKQSRRQRRKIIVYAMILITLIFSHLILLLGGAGLNWVESRLVDYFVVLLKLIFLTTILLGHVHFRRFIID